MPEISAPLQRLQMSAAQARPALMVSGAPSRTPQPNWCGLIAHSISDHRLSHFHERFPLSVFPCLFSLDRPPFFSLPSFPFLPFSHLFSPCLDEHGTPGEVAHTHRFHDPHLSPSTVQGMLPSMPRQTSVSVSVSVPVPVSVSVRLSVCVSVPVRVTEHGCTKNGPVQTDVRDQMRHG